MDRRGDPETWTIVNVLDSRPLVYELTTIANTFDLLKLKLKEEMNSTAILSTISYDVGSISKSSRSAFFYLKYCQFLLFFGF